MSTKIYNGYISTLNIEQLLKKFVTMVEPFETLRNNIYGKALLKQTLRKIDIQCVKTGKPIDNNKQYDILNEMHRLNEDELRKASKYHHHSHDYACSCSVIPMKGKTMILLFCADREMTAFWDELPFIKEYHYQDQTDPPSDIPSKDWNRRRKDWDKALQDDPPIKRGYTFVFTDERRIPSSSNVVERPDVKKAISLHKRKRALSAVDQAFKIKTWDKISKRYEKEGKKPIDFLGTISDEVNKEFKKFEKSAKRKAAIDRAEKILPKINFEPDKEHIQKKISKAWKSLKKKNGM